jgi:hypothetical protein
MTIGKHGGSASKIIKPVLVTYLVKGLSIEAIANRCCCSVKTIRRQIKRFDLSHLIIKGKRSEPNIRCYKGLPIALYNENTFEWRRKYNEKRDSYATIEECWECYVKQKGRCVYTNVELILCTAEHRYKYPEAIRGSIDRIDPSRGHVVGNIQWTSVLVNRIRNTLGHQEWIDLTNQVAINHPGEDLKCVLFAFTQIMDLFLSDPAGAESLRQWATNSISGDPIPNQHLTFSKKLILICLSELPIALIQRLTNVSRIAPT